MSITKEQLKTFLDNGSEEYTKVYEDRFKKIARKAFLDGCMAMAEFMESDGEFSFQWDEDTFKVIKLANDIDNANSYAEASKQLTLDQYQELAMRTCMPSCDNFSYMMLNLIGEVGELASKVAKDLRRGDVVLGRIDNDLAPLMPFDAWLDREEEYEKEAGDILWQLAGLCHVMGWKLNAIGEKNLAKLASRQKRGKIDGDGDNR